MSMTNNNFPVMPVPKVFLLETPLYKRFKKDAQKILELRDFTDTLDFYCLECGESSIFKRSDTTPSTLMAQRPAPLSGVASYWREEQSPFFDMQFECSRDKHAAIFYFRTDENSICKVGEFPSKADTFSRGVAGYKKILGRECMSLQIAQELYAQGFGAGSFVYLRRIFENAIVERVAARKYSKVPDWDFQVWKKENGKMAHKLKDLASQLPDFINNQELFRVLSAAVHELDETTCLQHFTTVENAIIEILDDEIALNKKEATRKGLGREVSRISRNLGDK